MANSGIFIEMAPAVGRHLYLRDARYQKKVMKRYLKNLMKSGKSYRLTTRSPNKTNDSEWVSARFIHKLITKY
ncbi:MAG: hypothetical protein D6780_06210 [Candidatus Dadabacteria bacterium]|nr:MAG: hypothetical protein D6780_06210 [Candidatus Dadabacteria bacterium]